ncbi:MAG: hypothetical protein WDM85_11765 [Caulobacteraceae bacterium]
MRRIAARYGLAALALSAALAATGPGVADTAATNAVAASDSPDPLHDAERSVVRVVTVSLDALGEPVALETGSGFAVAPGVVVTNHHVVQGRQPGGRDRHLRDSRARHRRTIAEGVRHPDLGRRRPRPALRARPFLAAADHRPGRAGQGGDRPRNSAIRASPTRCAICR